MTGSDLVSNSSAKGLLHFLQQIPDPRGREGQRHPHVALLAAVVCATLCGFSGYAGIAQWLRLQPLAFWHALGGKRKPPCENTFRYLLMKLPPRAFEAALNRWMIEGLGLSIDETLAGLVLDGKALRGTRARHARAMMVIAALDIATDCVFSQVAVDPTTNEAKTALALLETMVLQGKVVLGDAAYCDRAVCQTIRKKGGDYLLLVKDNQPALRRAAQQSFVIPKDFPPLRPAPGGSETRLDHHA